MTYTIRWWDTEAMVQGGGTQPLSAELAEAWVSAMNTAYPHVEHCMYPTKPIPSEAK